MSFPCDKCEVVCESRGALTHHWRESHQASATIKRDGETAIVERDGEGMFVCACLKRSKLARFLHSDVHAAHLLPGGGGGAVVVVGDVENVDAGAMGSVDAPVVVHADGGNGGELEDDAFFDFEDDDINATVAVAVSFVGEGNVFARLGLEWKVEGGLLFCDECQIVLKEGFARHLKDQHDVRVSRTDRAAILERCFDPVSRYLEPSAELLTPLSFLPVADGLRCLGCPYFCRDGTVMKRHQAHAGHSEAGSEACGVQALPQGSARKYFGVLVPTPALGFAELISRTMSRVLEPEAVDETIAMRNGFYAAIRWYPEPERADEFGIIDKAAMLALPGAGDELFPLYEFVRGWFSERMERIDEAEFAVRAALQSPQRPYSALQTSNSVSSYSALFTKLVVFAARLRNSNLVRIGVDVALAIDVLTSAPTSESLLAVLGQFLMEQVIERNTSHAVLLLFVRFSCAERGDDVLLPPSEVARLCAKLQYLCRLVCLEAVQSSFGTDRVVALEQARHTLDPGHVFSVFSVLVSIHALAKRISEQENRLPLIVLGTSDEEIFVQGLRIAASHLRRAADGALCEAQRLQEELLLGWPASALVLESVRDDFTNASLGYSIKADATEAGHRRVQQRLVEHVMSREALRNRFVEVTNEEEGVVWRLAEAEAYLCKYHQFIKVLVLLVHLRSGLPARATELATFRVSNGRSGMRSLYYVAGQVFLFGQYSKMRAKTVSNKGIARFLSKRVSWVLLLDLLVIRPFVASLFSRLHPGRGKEYLQDLFVVDGRRQEGEDLRRCFAQKFLALSGVPLSFSLYRHVAKHFSLKMKGQLYDGTGAGYEESDEEEEQDGFERQFGHSASTSNRQYGVTSLELRTLRGHILEEMRLVSSRWDQFLDGEWSFGRAAGTVVPVLISTPVLGQREEAVDLAANDESGETELLLESQSSHSEDVILSSESLATLSLLRRLKGDQAATFRNQQQQAAADLLLHRQRDLLLIMPTGSGKTMLLLLNALHKPDKTSIVVVPTISLRDDIVQRARALLQVCQEARSYRGEQLLIVTPEAAGTTDFHSL